MAKPKPPKRIIKKHLAREQREAKQKRIILIVSIAIGVTILGLAIFGVIDQAFIRPKTPVARVGDTKITVGEFKPFVQYSRVQMLNQAYQYYTFNQQFGDFGGNFLDIARSIVMELSQPVIFGRTILDEMIDNIIIKEEAAKRGLTVSEAEIDAAVQAVFSFFPDGTPTPTKTAMIQPTPTYSDEQLALISTLTSSVEESEVFNGEDEPLSNLDVVEDTDADEAMLDADEDTAAIEALIEPVDSTPEATPTITLTPTPYSTKIYGQNIKEFEKLYKIYNFDVNSLREIFRVQLLREKLIDSIELNVETTKTEVWARHILVSSEDFDLAVEILSRLEGGENFFDLAALYSLDESNKDLGGDLGWFDDSTMVPEFTEAVFSLSEGEISQPVETAFGYHIIQLIGQRESQVTPSQVTQQRQQAFTTWLAEQRSLRDDIVIYDDWDQHVPVTPEVPPQFIQELYQ
ncbi:MAG: hypothetical protein GX142_10245 [Chloroflexi bacterium]|nr:hypothetical protein [Chloroflexota bacterium]